MSIELKMLLYAVVLLIVQLIMQIVAEMMQNGVGWVVSARDDDGDSGGYAARFERAFYNMLETFPIFAALALMIELTQSWNPSTALGAQLYFWGRVLYVPAYVAGIPYIRSIIWTISVVGIVMLAWAMLAPLAGVA